MQNKLRENIAATLLASHKPHYVLECATGVGKSYLALQKMAQLYSPECKVLIVIPRNVLIQNWIEEFKKWNYEDMLNNVTFVTYVSFPKMMGTWDIVIADEVHHLSERCREALAKGFHIKHFLGLSATISKEVKGFLIEFFWQKHVEWIKVNTKKAIDAECLPDPTIFLLPLTLNNTISDCLYVKKKAKKGENLRIVPYSKRWEYRNTNIGLAYKCTPRQYYTELSGLINWYKSKNYNPVMKNMWLQKAGERLKFLADQKIYIVNTILTELKDKRTIVFCGTINQSRDINAYMVNSKVGDDNLNKFNAGEINIISCVNMLDEGCNLTDCQVGVFDMLNSSDRMQVQKCGRLLRHSNPIIIIPYFKNTRDEEILNKMLEDYNKDKIKVMHSITELATYTNVL